MDLDEPQENQTRRILQDNIVMADFKCRKCGQIKADSEYAKGRRVCKKCRSEYRKKHFAENYDRLIKAKKESARKSWAKHRERRMLDHQAWIEKNREWHLLYHAEYNKAHREHYKKLSKARYEKKKDRLNQLSREYHRTHRPQINEYARMYDSKRMETDPNYRLSRILRDRIRTALKRDSAKKCESSVALLGCSVDEARKHIEAQFLTGMTWENHGKWHIDHIRPCASFDLTDPEQQKQCFHYTNLQPLWAEDNIRKSDKVA